MLIIHRLGESDEIVSASEFRRRARESEQHDAAPAQTAANRSARSPS